MGKELKNYLKLDHNGTTYDVFREYYQEHPDHLYIIFGAGDIGQFALKFLSNDNIRIHAFCDNSPQKAGTYIKNVKVIGIEELRLFTAPIEMIINDSYYIEKQRQVLALSDITLKTWRFDMVNPLFKKFYKPFIVENLEKFQKSFELFKEPHSQKVFIAVLNCVLTGDMAVFEDVYSDDEYFPKDLAPVQKEHIFLDVGAYDGQTSRNFIDFCQGEYRHIYAFEPIQSSCELIKKEDFQRFTLFQVMASDQCGTETVYENDYTDVSMATSIETGKPNKKSSVTFQADTIDNLVKNEKVTFIKMDIEGSELKALKGAENTIVRNTPFLAICVYHRKEDLIDIVQYIHSIVPGYKFYLRHHSITPVDTVLYCLK